MTRPRTDWEGCEVPADEHPDTPIKAWLIDPDLSGRCDEVVIRGYQDMLDYVATHLESKLDDMTEEELTDAGFTLKIRLVKTTVGDMPALDSQEN